MTNPMYGGTTLTTDDLALSISYRATGTNAPFKDIKRPALATPPIRKFDIKINILRDDVANACNALVKENSRRGFYSNIHIIEHQCSIIGRRALGDHAITV